MQYSNNPEGHKPRMAGLTVNLCLMRNNNANVSVFKLRRSYLFVALII